MVTITDNITGLGDKLERNAKEAFNTVATDIQRTSADASPKDTGHLEKNHLDIQYGGTTWNAIVWFMAFNGSFDYAHWTHTADYRLGTGSEAKSGGSSRFAGHVPVGKGYLSNTVSQGHTAYVNHISSAITDTIG